MNSAPVATTGLLILLLGGCQQPNNPAIPLSPISPLGANTRVPPPQTGSYAVPNGYYQGQASAAPLGGSQYATAGASGPAAAHDGTPTPAPTLNGWSDSGSAAVASAATGPGLAPFQTAVQPAAYQSESGPVASGGAGATLSGSGSAPRIPASALQSPGYSDSPLRPNLRGMQVLDMTAPSTLMPSDPPSLQVVDPAQMRTANAISGPSSAPAFRSLSPAAEGQAGTAAAPAAVQQPAGDLAWASATTSTSATASAPPASSASAAPAEVPSTSKPAKPADSAELPWQRPNR